jgi:acetyl esterase/lipase
MDKQPAAVPVELAKLIASTGLGRGVAPTTKLVAENRHLAQQVETLTAQLAEARAMLYAANGYAGK